MYLDFNYNYIFSVCSHKAPTLLGGLNPRVNHIGITLLWTEVSNSAPTDDGMKRSRGEIQPTPSTHVTPEGKKGHVEADVAPRKLFDDETYTGGGF